MIKRLVFVVSLSASIPIIAVGTASSVSAADATGCSGSAESYGPEGGLLDSMAAPGDGGTKADPFDIFADGTVRYAGRTDAVMRNGTWSVDIGGALGVLTFLVETISRKELLSGKIKEGGDTSRSGEFAVNKYASKLTGLQVVTVQLRGEDGAACDATIWIRVHGKFFKSLLAVGGLMVLLIALYLFTLGAPSWAIENLMFEGLEKHLGPPVPEDKE